MASEALDIQDAVPQLVPCVSCGQMDGVVRVPVAHQEACAEYRLPLVDELRVVPPRQRWAGRVLGAGMASVFGVDLGIHAATTGTGQLGTSVFLVLFCLTSGVLAANWSLGVVGAVRRQRRLARGLPAAEEVWRHGWYCRRCDLVYFQPAYAPAGVDPRTPLTTGEFRRMVFTAGGYEDLA
jgi:hypothetical protein